ncbi:MAG: hypothetical protein M3391_02100, partial [Actinomycetota bacterium]|nr:hypothetical protein [Actinomycetota bacterium]
SPGVHAADDFRSELFPAAPPGAAPPPPPPTAPQPLWGTPQAMQSTLASASSSATRTMTPPPPPVSGPPVASWSRPTQPVDGPPADAYFKKAVVAPRTSFEADLSQAPTDTTRSKSKVPLRILAIAVVAVAAYFVTSTLFFNGEPHLNTGADGEITVMKPKRFFRPLIGYQYQEVPEVFLEQARSIVAADPVAQEAMENLTARGVMEGGQVVAGAVVISIDPEFMSNRGERRSGLVELEKATDASAERVEIDGKVAYLSSGAAWSGSLTYYENLMVMVAGPTEQTMRAVTAELLKAQP